VYFLYVPEERDAEEAAKTLCRQAFETGTVRPLGGNGAMGKEWLVVSRQRAVPSPAYLRRTRTLFGALAARYGGSYDGWEASIERPGTDPGRTARPFHELVDTEVCDIVPHA
jgi:hypothetical protein